MTPETESLEFWPERQGGPPWTGLGVSVDLDTLSLPGDRKDRVPTWFRLYDDDKLPIDGPGEEQWLDDGRRLSSELRDAVEGRFEVIVTEPWWGAEPAL
jgi:hypothetical protein